MPKLNIDLDEDELLWAELDLLSRQLRELEARVLRLEAA